MSTIRRTVAGGIMDKDTDERLLPDGFYRHAENLNISTTNDSDEGSAENSIGNTQRTNIDFGNNPIAIGGIECEMRKKLYYCVVSDSGSYIMEYDTENIVTTPILIDTRPPVSRVLNFKRNKNVVLIKITAQTEKEDLLLLTDNNMEVLCLNISRCKTFVLNGFSEKDIYLIKQPPLSPPKVLPLNLPIESNDLAEKFISFCYRYQYEDEMYSALSPFSNYVFSPDEFKVDFFELNNKGMKNHFNSIKVSFNTGSKQVKKIQLCFKESNSDNIYIIDTFTKEIEGWADEDIKSSVFFNNKIYKVLPEKELYRLFDNIPQKAKNMDLVGNRLMLGDYTTGYNMLTKGGNPVKIDMNLSFNSYDLDPDIELDYDFGNVFFNFYSPTDIQYEQGDIMFISINVQFESIPVYSNTFQFVLSENFDNLLDLVSSNEFNNLTEFINVDFQQHYNENNQWTVPPNYSIKTHPNIEFYVLGEVPGFFIYPIVYEDTGNGNAIVTIPTTFILQQEESESVSPVSLSKNGSSQSCKSNQSYAVGLIYRDKWGRGTTIQKNEQNTVFIPLKFSDKKNKLKLQINHEAPKWADNFRVAVKTNPLVYHNVIVNEYYNEGVFVWAKLEYSNKDKVQAGDYLILKTAPGFSGEGLNKIKVLDVQMKESNFISGNKFETEGSKDEDIIESGGLYMKIRPTGFSMDVGDYEMFRDESSAKSGSFRPAFYLNFFSKFDEESEEVTDLPIGVGSIIKIRLSSSRTYKNNYGDTAVAGWNNVDYDKEFIAERDYDTIEEWIDESFLNGSTLYATHRQTGASVDITDKVSKIRGFMDDNIFTPDSDGYLYLLNQCYYDAPSGSRKAYTSGEIIIRSSAGIYIFETSPIQAESEVYYEVAETHAIVDGNHIVEAEGQGQNQDIQNNIPATIELSFFNCFTQGNGVESYHVFDDFNTKALSIDYRASLVSVEEFKENNYYASITYGEPYVDSSNINGLNEFNASTANWMDLDKKYGAIQVIKERMGNVLVVQKNRWGQILYGKDLLFNADGTSNLTSVPQVLGQYIPYAGEYGISHPESFANHGNKYYGVDVEKGVYLRLSQNGLTAIVRGMKKWFKEILSRHNRAKIIGGIDPQNNNRYQTTIGKQPPNLMVIYGGENFYKYNITEPFNYVFEINKKIGSPYINYNIITGTASLSIVLDGNTTEVTDIEGRGTVNLNKTTEDNQAFVTITPSSSTPLNIELEHFNIPNKKLRIITIVIGDKTEKTITNSYKWGNSSYFREVDFFDKTSSISRWDDMSGNQGQNRFPTNNSNVIMQTLKSNTDSADFDVNKGHRLGYLVTSDVYEQAQLNTILSLATFPVVNPIDENTNECNFEFSRSNDNEILYLIWDYNG